MTVNVGEIRLFAGKRVPTGWMICDGSSLDTGKYSQLYTAIGKTYGSTGPSSFNLPDLSARVPIHRAAAYPLGVGGGAETVTLTAAQIPAHNHTLSGTDTAAASTAPGGNLVAQSSRFSGYQASVPGTLQMGSSSISVEGANTKAHENLQPFLCINYIIAVFPAPLPAANAGARRVAAAGSKAAAKPEPAATAKANAKAKPAAKEKAGAKKQGSAKAKPVAKTKAAAKAKPSRRSKSAKPIKARTPKTRRAAPTRAKRPGKATRAAPSKRGAARKTASKKSAGNAKTGKRSASRTAKRARR